MKDKIFGVLQRVGRSFMLPIALLPVAGLLLGIGSSFTNPTTIETYRLGNLIREGNALYTVLDIMSRTGSIVFDNLALLFAMGVAIGMAKREKEVAALSGAIAYLIMNASISTLIHARGGVEAMAPNSTASVLGITTLQMGVFGGIIVGLGVAALHNRFYKIELPQVLSFFGGTRFVPIISSIVYLIAGIVMFFIWPAVQAAIAGLGQLVLNSGYAGTWLYGIIERALIPFGLHHVFYMPFWQTELGGSQIIDGATVLGAQNIFFAELASKSTTSFSVSATRFMAGKFPFMIFGLPAAAFAMYRAARPEKRRAAGGLLLSAALTSMITGITEPLEFTFLFVAPAMYAVHCVLAGLSYMLMHICGVGVGMTFSGGLIDLTLFGILQGNAKTNWIWIIIVGAVYAVVYYFVFYFMITKLDLKTPGREAWDQETRLYSRKDMNAAKAGTGADRAAQNGSSVSAVIVRGLGGRDNLADLDCCATRLRVTVKDASAVSDELLRSSGASGVIRRGNGVQVIYGPRVSVIKSDLEDYLAAPEPEESGSGPLEDEVSVEAGQGRTEKKAQAGDACVSGTASGSRKRRDVLLAAHMNGRVLPLAEVADEVFSAKLLGDGAAIEPEEGKLYAPCRGTVTTVAETGHAVSLTLEDGLEILLHIGLDTVKLGGKYFAPNVREGQKVEAGELLVSFDMDAIRAEGYALTTPLIVCSADGYGAVRQTGHGKVKAGAPLITVEAGN